MSKVTIRKGPASQYEGQGEAIFEFSDGKSGGLLAFRRNDAGTLLVDVYRTDDDVQVRTTRKEGTAEANRLADLMAEGVTELCILAYGNPVDGSAFVGPFSTSGDATLYAETEIDNTWWIAQLEPPIWSADVTPKGPADV